MKVGEKEVELFEIIAKQSDDTIDKYNLFAGELERQRSNFERSFIILSSLKLITIKNEGRSIIIKLPSFHEAVLLGGLNEFITNKSNKERLERQLLKSTIAANKNSRNSNIIALVIGTLTLAALIVEILINLRS